MIEGSGQEGGCEELIPKETFWGFNFKWAELEEVLWSFFHVAHILFSLAYVGSRIELLIH